MNISAREQILFVTAAVLVALFLAYAFAVLPALERYRHQGVLIREKTRRADLLEKELLRGDSIDERYRLVKSRMHADRSRTVSQQTLFTDLQTLAGPMGIQVTGVDPLPVKEYDYYREYAVLIDVETDIEALVHLLYEIEKGRTRLRVQRLVVSPIEPGQPALRAQIQVTTRTFHEEAANQ